jgi:hypothetical protein
MADKFQRSAPTFQFFRDGEQLRVKKLGTILQGIQDGMDQLEAGLGDIHNREIVFYNDNPLFQNSIGRAMGPMDQTNIVLTKRFEIINRIKNSLHQGLIRWPWADDAASTAGNQSLNLIPVFAQSDKMGIGCANDDGTRCTAGFQTIFNREKTILVNGQFDTGLELSGWDTQNAEFNSNNTVDLSLKYRYNLLTDSEQFENWTATADTTLGIKAVDDPNGQSNGYSFQANNPGAQAVSIALSGSVDQGETSSDWTFSVYLASSGERNVHLQIGDSTPDSLTGSPGHGSTLSRYYTVTISGTTWDRYYVHNTYGSPIAGDSIVARINLAVNDTVGDETLYLFGAQLEPTKSPTDYQRTTGEVVSGLVGVTSIAQTFSAVPGHRYVATVESSLGGDVYFRVGGVIDQALTGGQDVVQFTPIDPDTSIEVEAIGVSAATNTVSLVRVDPGTPCHAMNCPGFSAYQKVRNYRGVLPPVTTSGHQAYGDRLQLPDEFRTALSDDLPGNILGIFDFELNHLVPRTLIDWQMANWPIGGVSLGGLVSDPEFTESFISSNGGLVPSDFGFYTSGAGGDATQNTETIGVTRSTVTEDLPWGWEYHNTAVAQDYHHYLSGVGGGAASQTDGIWVNESFTVDLWVKYSGTAYASTKLGFLGRGRDTAVPSPNGVNYSIWIAGDTGKLGVTLHRAGEATCHVGAVDSPATSQPEGYYYRASSPDIRDDQWHHVAAYYEKGAGGSEDAASKVYVWLDGLFMDSGIAQNSDTFPSWDWNVVTDSAVPADIQKHGTTCIGALGRDSGADGALGEYGAVRQVLFRRGNIYNGLNVAGGRIPTPAALIPSGIIDAPWPESKHGIMAFMPMEEGGYSQIFGGGSYEQLEVRSGLVYELLSDAAQPPTVVGSGEYYALGFAGNNNNQAISYVENAAQYAVSGDFTLDAWVNISGDAGGDKTTTICRRANSAETSENFWLYTDTQGLVNFQMSGATSGYIAASGTTDIANSLWHHIGVTVAFNPVDSLPAVDILVDGVHQTGTSGIGNPWDWSHHDDMGFDAKFIVGQKSTSVRTDNPRQIRQLMCSSGIQYNEGGIPILFDTIKTRNRYPIWSFSMNEGVGTAIWDRGLELRPPLEFENPSAITWASNFENFSESFTTEEIDEAKICTTSGSRAGLEKVFPLEPNELFTWTYTVQAGLGHAGVIAQVIENSGTAQVDFELDGEFIDVVDSAEFPYQISGSIYPGEDQLWASESNQVWTIRHKILATEPDTFVTLRVLLEGAQDECMVLDSFDLIAKSDVSTSFRYCGDGVLGLNAVGPGNHVIDENLLPWSEQPQFWNGNHAAPNLFIGLQDPSGLDTAFMIQASGAYVGYEWTVSDSDIRDPSITLQAWLKTNSPSASVSAAKLQLLADGTELDSVDLEIGSTFMPYAVYTSGIDLSTNLTVQARIVAHDPGGHLVVAWPVVHHGSGVVDYIKTGAAPKNYYRKAVKLDQRALLNGLSELHALVTSVPIQTNLIQDSDGTYFYTGGLGDFSNFPASGVVNVAGQEFSYRNINSAGYFAGLTPGWRGTDFNPVYLISGARVTYVPLPQPVTRVVDDIMHLDQVLPAADGDWANKLEIKLYNTQIENLDRWALTASAVPLTRAVGSLMTSFIRHTADHRRHFRRDQICSHIIDPSTCGDQSDLLVDVTLVTPTVEEVNGTAILNIFAFGFPKETDKKVTVSWGDGQSTVINSVGRNWTTISHIYDLGATNTSTTHTITVVVEDLDLKVSRNSAVTILVTPRNKGTQIARSQILLQPTATQTSRANVQAKISQVQMSRAFVGT